MDELKKVLLTRPLQDLINLFSYCNISPNVPLLEGIDKLSNNIVSTKIVSMKGKTENYGGGTITFIEKLGEGSTGSVWAGKLDTGEQVVIKIIDKITNISLMVTNEINSLKHISSICKNHAVCYKFSYIIDQVPRIVMEYIPGQTLIQYIKTTPVEERAKYITLLLYLIKGLDTFFKLGIIHQDINSNNIIIDKRDKLPKYIDWGLGCLKTDCCKEPCLFKSFNEGQAVDVFNLGKVLREIYEDKNDLANKLIPLLLEPDQNKRLEHFSNIVKCVVR